jgi:transcriptional regulator with XRE-family HTH domain
MARKRYGSDMTTLDAIRKGIRRGRRDREMTLNDLADASGVARGLVHQMELPEKYPNYSPEFDTIIKIVEDGLRLSLCDFICWVEGKVQLSDLGFPPMPEDMVQRALAAQAKTRPKRQPSESKPATHRTNAKDRRLTRPR